MKAHSVRQMILVAATVLVLGVMSWSVYAKEDLIANGETVYLELAPRDPRSLMQGDYMVLNYAIGNEISVRGTRNIPKRGYAVIAAKNGEVAQFVRVHDGARLAEGERLLRYHGNGWRPRIVPDSYLFQEGHRKYYESAKYGVFKFDGAGKTVLVGLADAEKKLIEPPATAAREVFGLSRD